VIAVTTATRMQNRRNIDLRMSIDMTGTDLARLNQVSGLAASLPGRRR
jgi:hypothetical protein